MHNETTNKGCILTEPGACICLRCNSVVPDACRHTLFMLSDPSMILLRVTCASPLRAAQCVTVNCTERLFYSYISTVNRHRRGAQVHVRLGHRLPPINATIMASLQGPVSFSHRWSVANGPCTSVGSQAVFGHISSGSGLLYGLLWPISQACGNLSQ